MYAERCLRILLAAATAVLTAFGPAAALANAPLPSGVHVDPGSPAAKVYVIPITAGRSETSGARPSPGSAANVNPPLFGIGITPSRMGGSTQRIGRSGRSTVKARSHSRGAHAGSGGSVIPPLVGSGDPSGASGSGWPALAVGGAIVLLLGGGGGLALRRRL